MIEKKVYTPRCTTQRNDYNNRRGLLWLQRNLKTNRTRARKKIVTFRKRQNRDLQTSALSRLQEGMSDLLGGLKAAFRGLYFTPKSCL